MLRRRAALLFPLAIAVLLTVGMLVPTAGVASSTFADVAGTDYDSALDALAEEGILTGCAEGEFCPEDELTRGQMATLLVTALGLTGTDGDHFSDVEGTTHEASINTLAASGITQGCSIDEFCPDDGVTRGQLASLLTRSFEISPSNASFFDDVEGVHASAVNGLARDGIAAGCGVSLVAYCPDEPVERWQAALFFARSMDLVERVELASLEDRRAQQAELDAEAERRAEEQAEQEVLSQEAAEPQFDPVWDRLADCESGDRSNGEVVPGTARWATGATDPARDERPSWSSGLFDGGLQFHPDTWSSFRDSDMPANAGDATREQQIEVGIRVQAAQGWAAWPTCSRMIGLR